jgi:hypothetical protein
MARSTSTDGKWRRLCNSSGQEGAMKTTRYLFPLALLLLAFGARQVVGREAAGTAKIDPQADQMLHQMSDYMKGLKSFKVQAHNSEEVVLPSGQKVDKTRETEASLLRPNRLQSTQVGKMAFYYDGSEMTLFCKKDNTYATAPAPKTLEATVEVAREKMQINPPGGNLVSDNPYAVLTKDVTSGRFVGKETVGGVAANHLAFRGKDADWQIWIQDGDQPLPLRYQIVDKTAKGQPKASVLLTNWQPQANLSDDDFKFQPPAGASKVDKFPATCGATEK